MDRKFNVGRYAKALVAALAAAAFVAVKSVSDGTLTGEEIFTIAGAALGSLGAVYSVPNDSE